MSNQKFKAGDLVEVLDATSPYYGLTASICSYEDSDLYLVEMLQSSNKLFVHESDLALVPGHGDTDPFIVIPQAIFGPATQQPTQPSTGNRFNSGKVRYRNFPLWLAKPLAEVGTRGELKYGTFNFLKGLSVADCLDSLDRHREKVDDPFSSDLDEESQLHHLAHVAWNALVALHMIKHRPDLDDRYKTTLNKEINSNG